MVSKSLFYIQNENDGDMPGTLNNKIILINRYDGRLGSTKIGRSC